jgi:hypothetical protein
VIGLPDALVAEPDQGEGLNELATAAIVALYALVASSAAMYGLAGLATGDAVQALTLAPAAMLAAGAAVLRPNVPWTIGLAAAVGWAGIGLAAAWLLRLEPSEDPTPYLALIPAFALAIRGLSVAAPAHVPSPGAAPLPGAYDGTVEELAAG